ncbi:hypothetical protein JXA85_08040 [Candidatus Woesearchaeota archaeon]|nr:hypothetical protein [Candidatus Woesearchaeota archaeon]
MRKKKGSLNLSINAIVVLVMAITLLGLGLAFIRGKMDKASNLIDDVEESIKTQISTDFAKTDAKISFPRTTIKVKSSDEYVFAMGIKNINNGLQAYRVSLIYQSGPDDVSGSPAENSLITSFDSIESGKAMALQFFGNLPKISAGEYKLIPIKVMTHNAIATSTYFIRVEVCESDDNGATCNSAGIYDQKEFFIEIV